MPYIKKFSTEIFGFKDAVRVRMPMKQFVQELRELLEQVQAESLKTQAAKHLKILNSMIRGNYSFLARIIQRFYQPKVVFESGVDLATNINGLYIYG